MGWETAAYIGLSLFSAADQQKQARKQAEATVAEGNVLAANKAKDVQRLAATQRVSFLNSGITLEGTPMNVIDETFNTGITDINQISSNYNTKAKGQIAAGRSAAISSLASSFSNASMPDIGLGDFAKDFSFGYDNAATFQTGATPGTLSTANTPAFMLQPSNAKLPWA